MMLMMTVMMMLLKTAWSDRVTLGFSGCCVDACMRC